MSSREPTLDCAESADAAPYVLGALDDPTPYSEHLATCAICQAEVAELQLVADALPRTVSPVAAPEDLRRRVLATVRSEAELLHAAGSQLDERAVRPGRQRSKRTSYLGAGVAIAAAVAAAAVIALSVGSSTPQRITPAQIAASVRGAHADLREIGGHAELVVSGMPQPAPGKIYEVWLNRAGSPQPTDALFGVTSTGKGSVSVPDSLHGVKEVLVTSEPVGGSLLPTSTPLIRVVLPT
jgi:anti-sigma-K factor RskA